MSFETERRKMRAIWEKSQDNKWSLDSATLVQGKRELQIPLTEPKVVTFGKFQSANSEWIAMEPKGVLYNGTYTYRAAEFYVEMTVPEKWIPYARCNLAYRRTDNLDVFSGTTITVVQFCQVIDVTPANPFGLPRAESVTNMKKVRWNYAFVQNNYTTTWYDYEIKLFFTMINPNYITVS